METSSDDLHLITCATGQTGRHTVCLLLPRGHMVCALVQRADDRSQHLEDAGAEVISVDVLNHSSVRRALEGVNRAYFEKFADRLRADGAPEHLVQHLSNAAVDCHNGLLSGAGDVVERIGKQLPMTVGDFVLANKDAFTPASNSRFERSLASRTAGKEYHVKFPEE